MNEKLITLNEFFNINNNSINDFYTITIYKDILRLQGEFTTEKAQKYSKLNFLFSFNKHLNGKSETYPNIEITLT